MKHTYQIALAIYLLFSIIAPSSLSAGSDADKIIAKVQKKYSTMDDMAASFIQQILFKTTRKERIDSGKVWIKHAFMCRIELGNSTIVTNGETLWTYVPMHNQLIVDYYKPEQQSLAPQKILTSLPEQSSCNVVGNEKVGNRETVVLEMIPKKHATPYETIKVWVDKTDWTLRKIEMIDASQNVSTYTIYELKFNSGIPDKNFIFVPPKGTEVIDMREE